MVRIHGTVLCHYVLELAGDGAVTRFTFDMQPLGAPNLPPRHVIVELTADSKAQSHRVDYFDVAQAAKPFAAGSYSLWTFPKKDGSVDLIVNSQHGQYGTDYDGSHDIVRIPMQVGTVTQPQESFAIAIANNELSISWDTFVWTVLIALQ